MISFGFYSTCYKVYIYLPCINTHRQIISLFNINHFDSSSEYQTPILCQVWANYCGGYRNSDVFYLLQRYLTIHYCNQSVLAIFPDLNIVVWSITFIFSFQEVPWYITYLLSANYFYTLTRTKFLQCGFVTRLVSLWSPFHRWVQCIFNTKIWYYGLCCFFWFQSYCLIVCVHLRCINTQRWTTTPFSLWLPLSRVSVLCCTTKIRFNC